MTAVKGNMRIGQGFDIHPFAPGRALILGGVKIPGTDGLAGHSDADAVLHALTDALLGGIAAGDIGKLFPDSDAANKGRDSRDFVAAAMEMVKAAGWSVSNVDIIVVCEKPRLAPYVDAMRRVVAGLLAVEVDAVSIKATRAEGLGAIGRGEGLAATAAVLLARSQG